LNVVPALIADLGDETAWRYVEFFTALVPNNPVAAVPRLPASPRKSAVTRFAPRGSLPISPTAAR